MPKKWCTIAPIPYWDIGEPLDEPVNFGCGVILWVVPNWLKEEQITKHLSEFHREQLLHVKFALMVEYDADSLREPDSGWRGQQPRSKQDRALELITLANLALWIAMPSSIGFDLVVDADCPPNAWSFRQSSEVPPLIPHKKDVANRPTKSRVSKNGH